MPPITPTLAMGAAALLALSALALGPRPAVAQDTPTTRSATAPPDMGPGQQRAAIDRLAYMVGDWQGDGWILQGSERLTFRGGERVQRKLDGLALLVEGRFTARPPGAAADVPVHTTLGVIAFDPRAERYRFHTWLATGASGEHELELIPDGWRWSIATGAGIVRYTTVFTSGEWVEVGEMQPVTGGPWRQFFAMRLRRVGDGG